MALRSQTECQQFTDRDGRRYTVHGVGCNAQSGCYGTGAVGLASRLGARNSTVVSARVPHALMGRVAQIATAWKITPGQLVRGLITMAALDPDKALGKIIAALGLPDNADAQAITVALENLLSSIAPSESDPLSPNADPMPAQASLSPATLAELKRRGMSTSEFLSRKARAVRSAK